MENPRQKKKILRQQETNKQKERKIQTKKKTRINNRMNQNMIKLIVIIVSLGSQL